MRSTLFNIILLLSLLEISCNDSLPPYVAPTDFLRATIRNISPPEVYYSYWDTGNDIAFTNISISTAPQVFSVEIVSTYEETLQDQLELSGSMVIESVKFPDFTVTIPFTVSSVTGAQYNPTTKLLTLNPGDTLKLKCNWRYRADSGKWAFEKADVAGEVDGNNSYDLIHAPMGYSASARVKLFRTANIVASEKKEFQLLFFGHIYVPPRF